MQILFAIGVTILAATQAQPQAPLLSSTKPAEITFVNAEFKDAISLMAKTLGLVVEMDQTVTEDMQRQKVGVIKLRDVTLEQAIATLTNVVGLSYEVVNEKTVRIFKKG